MLSTDCQGPILLIPLISYSQYVIVRYRYCPYWGYTRSISDSVRFIVPEFGVFRGSILQALPVLALSWEDTASTGNILGLCTADVLLPLYGHYLFGR